MGSVKKKYRINSSIDKVYKALTDAMEIEQWSGSSAIMESIPKGEFSLWGGSIVGINQVIEKNIIEQLWKEHNWAEYSYVTFKIEASGQESILTLEHENIPKSSVKNISRGWDEYYLGPLKSYLEL